MSRNFGNPGRGNVEAAYRCAEAFHAVTDPFDRGASVSDLIAARSAEIARKRRRGEVLWLGVWTVLLVVCGTLIGAAAVGV